MKKGTKVAFAVAMAALALAAQGFAAPRTLVVSTWGLGVALWLSVPSLAVLGAALALRPRRPVRAPEAAKPRYRDA